MKKITAFISVACLSLVAMCIISCGAQKIQYSKIMFGKGGGFTGKYDEYFLAKNGNIYKKEPSTNSFTKIKSLSTKQTRTIFKEVDDNKLFELGFNHPYNITSYLEIVKDSVSNKIAWGDSRNPPPAAVTGLFDKLMEYVVVPQKISKPNTKK